MYVFYFEVKFTFISVKNNNNPLIAHQDSSFSTNLLIKKFLPDISFQPPINFPF